MIWRVTVSATQHPFAATLLATAPLAGVTGLCKCDIYRIYHLHYDGEQNTIEQICRELLVDHVIDQLWINDSPPSRGRTIEVAFHAGVNDNEAREIELAAKLLGANGLRAATSWRYDLGDLDDEAVSVIGRHFLANDTIEHWREGTINVGFTSEISAKQQVTQIPLADLSDAELVEVSRTRLLSLDVTEMRAIQDYFKTLGREPSDAELETLAQTWSEHCVHKTFNANIELTHVKANGQTVISCHNGLLAKLRQVTQELNPWWLRSAFVDDAGIVAFDNEFDVAIKVETHNHPSALEPFGGANTGVGGVVRDILGVSARPIACTNVLCFGDQDINYDKLANPLLHPRQIKEGVVAGIADYGNKLGLPTVAGAVLYDHKYTANPLVYCGAIGLLRRGVHRNQAQVGDQIICIGGRVGRDGIHGATFSSANLDANAIEQAGAAVQIGDPITQKGCIEVVVQASEAGLYNAITDCGAGGLSSAIGEMGKHLGVEVDLANVPLKYPGLLPCEIWISEAQERMVLAVPDHSLASLAQICEDHEVEFSNIGCFTNSGELVVYYGDRKAIELSMDFLHEGLPQRTMTATWVEQKTSKVSLPPLIDEVLLELLAHPDVASKEEIVRRYDHEVRSSAVVRPFVGKCGDGPADAAVIKPLGTHQSRKALVVSCGLCPRVGMLDPYTMSLLAIDEAVRNLVAVGGNPQRVALLDNFCWPDPTKHLQLGALVRAVQGCVDGSRRYAMPFISGKDSLYNEFAGQAIPPTLLITALGVVPDLHCSLDSAGMSVGDDLWLVGHGSDALGGSIADSNYALDATAVPQAVTDPLPRYLSVHSLIMDKLISAAHDCSDGGIAVAVAEMAIGAVCGVSVDVPADGHDAFTALVNEGAGRLVLAAPRFNRGKVAKRLARHGRLVGKVIEEEQIHLNVVDEAAKTIDRIDVALAAARGAFTNGGSR